MARRACRASRTDVTGQELLKLNVSDMEWHGVTWTPPVIFIRLSHDSPQRLLVYKRCGPSESSLLLNTLLRHIAR